MLAGVFQGDNVQCVSIPTKRNQVVDVTRTVGDRFMITTPLDQASRFNPRSHPFRPSETIASASQASENISSTLTVVFGKPSKTLGRNQEASASAAVSAKEIDRTRQTLVIEPVQSFLSAHSTS